ncbi:MAG: tRNA dimethylallyltransferase, partial [uncultured Rubellimicrobium sp.]
GPRQDSPRPARADRGPHRQWQIGACGCHRARGRRHRRQRRRSTGLRRLAHPHRPPERGGGGRASPRAFRSCRHGPALFRRPLAARPRPDPFGPPPPRHRRRHRPLPLRADRRPGRDPRHPARNPRGGRRPPPRHAPRRPRPRHPLGARPAQPRPRPARLGGAARHRTTPRRLAGRHPAPAPAPLRDDPPRPAPRGPLAQHPDRAAIRPHARPRRPRRSPRPPPRLARRGSRLPRPWCRGTPRPSPGQPAAIGGTRPRRHRLPCLCQASAHLVPVPNGGLDSDNAPL